jgi:hypothetical protein
MKEWKLNQEIFYRLNHEFDDDLNTKQIVMTDNIVDDAIRYFNEKDIGWIYPAKSYMVAICYARWIAEEFSEDVWFVLDDAELLYNNDPYFKSYSEAKEIYDMILLKINNFDFDVTQGMVPDVYKYFREEFLLDNLPENS